MENIQECKLCGKTFTETLQLLRAASVIEHYEIDHPGFEFDPIHIGTIPGMDTVINQPMDQLKVS